MNAWEDIFALGDAVIYVLYRVCAIEHRYRDLRKLRQPTNPPLEYTRPCYPKFYSPYLVEIDRESQMLGGELESLHETHLVAWAHFPEVECGIVDYESRPLPPAVPKDALA